MRERGGRERGAEGGREGGGPTRAEKSGGQLSPKKSERTLPSRNCRNREGDELDAGVELSYDEEWKNEEGDIFRKGTKLAPERRRTLIRNGISFRKSHWTRDGGTKLSC